MRRILGILLLTTLAATTKIPAVRPLPKPAVEENHALAEWLDQLAEAESGNDPALRILDVNQKYSYGCLQFQMATFRRYAEQYELLDNATGEDLRKHIYNCQIQRRLARLMLEDDYRNWRHWRNTVSKIGKPPRI